MCCIRGKQEKNWKGLYLSRPAISGQILTLVALINHLCTGSTGTAASRRLV
jgi:hypothetical protein